MEGAAPSVEQERHVADMSPARTDTAPTLPLPLRRTGHDP